MQYQPTQLNVIDGHLKNLLDVCSDAEGVLVATVDGHPVTRQCRRQLDFDRISAMASTFIALGDTLTAELNSGSCRNIILENEGGIVVFMHVNELLIQVSFCRNPKSLGMLLSASRICAESIRREI